MINVDMIQSLQAIPETVITFTNNDKIMVKEPLEEVSQRIVDYQRTIYSGLPPAHGPFSADLYAHSVKPL
jgi:flagellar protein FlbD